MGTKESHHLCPFFITKGKGVNLEEPIKRRGDKDAIKAFLFDAIEPVDPVNPCHETPHWSAYQ